MAAKSCPTCGVPIAESDLFCRACGSPLVERTVALPRDALRPPGEPDAPGGPPRDAAGPPAGGVERTVAMSREGLRAPPAEAEETGAAPRDALRPPPAQVEGTVAMSREALRPPASPPPPQSPWAAGAQAERSPGVDVPGPGPGPGERSFGGGVATPPPGPADRGFAAGVPAVSDFAAPARHAEYAGFWVRFLAVFIDGIILGIVSLVLRLVLGVTAAGLFNIVIGAAYFVYCFSQWGGQTIGARAVGIKVVDGNGGLLSPGAAFIRWLGSIVSSIILGIGYLMMIWDARKQTLHDKMAGSFVIKV